MLKSGDSVHNQTNNNGPKFNLKNLFCEPWHPKFHSGPHECHHCRNIRRFKMVVLFQQEVCFQEYTPWRARTYQGRPTNQRGSWGIISTLPEKNCVEELFYVFQQNMFPQKYFSTSAFLWNNLPRNAGKAQWGQSK